MEWMPIDTAPKDGSWVLICGGDCTDEIGGNRIVVAQWETNLNGHELAHGWWQFARYDGGYYGEYKNPTHWMPLPPNPTSSPNPPR